MSASLEPFQPRADRPWDRAAAGHLLRRAGFQPSETEARDALGEGPARTVSRLVSAPDESERHEELDALGDRFGRRAEIDKLRAWWLLRMTHTQRPLHARMAMMWHNHFATSNTKVRRPALLYCQLRTIEKHAMGSFRDLLLAMARDPAMIVWLDGNENVNGRPNENFARELFELFALGIGNYSENDIREAARAFTAWHQKNASFRFVAHMHDNGTKHVFDARGNLGGEDVIDATLARPACARFVALRLCHEFVTPEPPEELVNELARRLRASSYDLEDAVRALVGSEAMFDPRFRRARIKSPVEYAIGLVRSQELDVRGPDLAMRVSQMGQRLFEPPSVKGWEGHRSWLNTATMLVRLNTAEQASSADVLDAKALCKRYRVRTAIDAEAFALRIALDDDAPASVRRSLRSGAQDPADALRRALRICTTSPEYQMA